MDRATQVKFGSLAFFALAGWMILSAVDFHFKFGGDLNTAQGRIQSMSVRECGWSDGCGKRYSYIVQHKLDFKAPSGKRIAATWASKEIYARSAVKVGDVVQVKYRADDPSVNYVSLAGGKDRSPYQPKITLVAIFVLLIGAAGLFGWHLMFRRD